MIRRFLFSLVLVLAGFAAGLVVTVRTRTAESHTDPAPPPPAATAPAPDQRATAPAAFGVGPDFTRVAGVAVKGVANISSLQVVRAPNSPFTNDPFFRYFFGDDDMFGSRDRRSLSLGSGVIIAADGYIVTNNHVVGENMREITIALPDNHEVHGRVVGTDAATDIAFLKAELRSLPMVARGDASKLQVRES